jgi:hypothetical protein
MKSFGSKPRSSSVGALARALAVVICLAAFLTLPRAGLSQALYGTLTGTVTDKSGAVVPSVNVTLTNQDTGAVRTMTTGGHGDYRLTDLLPGTYTIALQAAGFAKFTQQNVTIEVNREVRVDVTLQLASVTAQVTVTEAQPILQTETAEVNHQISEVQIAQLPITSTQGRNFQALYSLIPGAAQLQEKNSTASNPSRAMSVNINGQNYMGNTTRIDGAVNYYGWLPYLVAYVPPADSIENVNFTTNSFNAEQGLAGGAAVNVTIKSGTRDLHGGAWEYYQDAALNARSYTATRQNSPTVPKNVFNQFGFNIGGPVYIPKILTGRSKLFFFQNFERTTRRQLISNFVNIPDTNMLGGDFSEVSSITTLYDPQPGGTGPYLPFASRPTFMSEYGCNCIPAARQSTAAAKMLSLLQPLSQKVVVTPALLQAFMVNDYFGTGTLAYNRNTSDSKIDYIPTDKTQIFGRYSVEPFSVSDPQELGGAGGGTFDGGQPGAASGRIQNVGLGASHVFTPNMVLDVDFGYTRQVTGAQSTLDLSLGDFGLDVLGIPGTNGVGTNYVGQPIFSMGGGSTNFNTLGNSNGANPFLFRDNQFTGDVNLSWIIGKHATKYGFSYYHFLLNHFQPTSGSGINNPRGGFLFAGGMTCGEPKCGTSNYNNLADFLLGVPNNNTSSAVTTAHQLSNPNALRWTEIALYAQDQWTATPKLTVNYGIRYEFYPPPYRDHTGVTITDPNLPQSANVEIGGVGGNPENAGLQMGWGSIFPRLGLAYRVSEKTVVRAGAGITSDPDSLRYLRDSFPEDLAPQYPGLAADSIAMDPANGNAPMTLTYGIPTPVPPVIVNGFASLPVTGSTVSAIKDYHRGYIESWNAFVQQEFTSRLVMNLGYVGVHDVRQLVQTGYLNAAPLPSGSTLCMANGQYNPSSPYFTNPIGSNPCNFAANEIVNQAHCAGAATPVCYNSGGIGMVEPLFSANYNGLQSQLTYNAGRLAQIGAVYTWSHAIDFEDNGAGSGSQGLQWNYPAYYHFNRGDAGYDSTNNIQLWGIYSLPFGPGHALASSGIAGAILGGFQLNGQLSHTSGFPFTVTANSNNTNAPGDQLYADLIRPYHQLSGRNRTVGNTAVSGGKPWFDPTTFVNPVQPTYSPTQTPSEIASPVFGNTGKNQFRGPGQTVLNASVFRSFKLYRESQFQIRFEAFNALNHALLAGNPNTTLPSATNIAAGNYGTFGMITSGYGSARALQFSGRFTF